MSPTEHLEVERKFEVDAQTALPEPDAFAPLEAGEPDTIELSATYFDTAELALARNRITLRRRTGGADEGWHLKLPGDGDGRREFAAPLGDGGTESGEVPDELRDIVLGLVRREPLEPIARIDTTRTELVLAESGGAGASRPVAELCDDRVRATSLLGEGGDESSEWREWEVELVDPRAEDAAAHLDAIAEVLHGAGAVDSGSSAKLARAIGPVETDDVGHESPLSHALRADRAQLLEHDPGARLCTVVGIHQARVAVRGLRSTIQSFAKEIDEELAADAEVDGHAALDPALLLAELKTFAAVLGKLRDLHVTGRRLAETVAGFDPQLVSPEVAARIATEIEREVGRAGLRVAESMRSERYLELLDSLDELVAVTSRADASAREKKKSARKRPEDVLLRAVDRQYERFTKMRTRTERDLETLDLTLAQREELSHVARKKAKALRRGVAALPESTSLRVTPLRSACQRLHTVLGDVQDSVTARVWLRRFAARAEEAGESTFGFGVLFEHERGFAERALEGFEADAAAVTDAYEELARSRRAARKKNRKKGTKTRKS